MSREQRRQSAAADTPYSEETRMLDAVIVSTACTALARSRKGAFNMTHGAAPGAPVLSAAITRAVLPTNCPTIRGRVELIGN
jgi:hypothetical protein